MKSFLVGALGGLIGAGGAIVAQYLYPLSHQTTAGASGGKCVRWAG